MTKSKGFTLIELMIVMVVVAILAAVAYPSYRESVRKGNRRAAQAEMMEIVNREHQFFIANRAYADEDDLPYDLPPDVGQHYDYEITLDAGPPLGFTVDFTAIGAQATDGDLSVDSLGVKTPAEKW
ncbi:MAG: prepilin-type N-terminal cleavage/methylation domain-containing protein [Pseudomonadota bacterium]|nr:prepilin-type N-terminal cleavage/methylation domain-containing protein [Pseudomonadota bacterium]